MNGSASRHERISGQKRIFGDACAAVLRCFKHALVAGTNGDVPDEVLAGKYLSPEVQSIGG
jgi:hypothetical protein